MKWVVGDVTYKTVAQYINVVQQNSFVAVAAGVVIHQHTRVLMANLREQADGMSGLSAEDMRAALRQRVSLAGASLSAPFVRSLISSSSLLCFSHVHKLKLLAFPCFPSCPARFLATE